MISDNEKNKRLVVNNCRKCGHSVWRLIPKIEGSRKWKMSCESCDFTVWGRDAKEVFANWDKQ